jgi:hypothetical protein
MAVHRPANTRPVTARSIVASHELARGFDEMRQWLPSARNNKSPRREADNAV